jgi:SSS family solute:Na+ symporter
MILWGALGTGVALFMDRRKNALDTWWEMAGLFGGGMLGLFLLGLLSKRARSADALIATLSGIAVILGMTFSPKRLFPPLLTIVFGTAVILLVGLGAARFRRTSA